MLRLKARLSQTDAAKLLGYSSGQFVSNWERDLCRIPEKLLPKLAEVYCTTKGVLIGLHLINYEKTLLKQWEKES